MKTTLLAIFVLSLSACASFGVNDSCYFNGDTDECRELLYGGDGAAGADGGDGGDGGSE